MENIVETISGGAALLGAVILIIIGMLYFRHLNDHLPPE
jgi:prolipoprotein diacylglyceryltransferase